MGLSSGSVVLIHLGRHDACGKLVVFGPLNLFQVVQLVLPTMPVIDLLRRKAWEFSRVLGVQGFGGLEV